MARRTRAGALLGASVCAVLLGIVPAMAGAGMERLRGTMGAFSPASLPVRIQAPRDGGGHAGREAHGMSLCFS